jgi:hypothetical protein
MNFLIFLAGLIDGDGSIDKRKYYHAFTPRHQRCLLCKKKVVGHGHVRKIKNKMRGSITVQITPECAYCKSYLG